MSLRLQRCAARVLFPFPSFIFVAVLATLTRFHSIPTSVSNPIHVPHSRTSRLAAQETTSRRSIIPALARLPSGTRWLFLPVHQYTGKLSVAARRRVETLSSPCRRVHPLGLQDVSSPCTVRRSSPAPSLCVLQIHGAPRPPLGRYRHTAHAQGHSARPVDRATPLTGPGRVEGTEDDEDGCGVTHARIVVPPELIEDSYSARRAGVWGGAGEDLLVTDTS
ncbi:hypothetical protein B0H17DRAFT_1040911 [Mycena rosella]|uniref:Uncharacterized protein n=1 Tax=Mycena rosella TaxID=1033263 RepID=A0AAD7GRK1_MYCRO|nr:hypothetical protein B0H17DRAFT_1040911 [Mycena rosella]